MKEIPLPSFKGQDVGTFSVLDTSSGWNHESQVFQDTSIDMNYFKEQLEFIRSLTVRERRVLSSYTHQGDRVLNGLLRNTLSGKELCEYMQKTNIPFEDIVTESNCITLAKSYLSEFSSIFQKVPILKTRMRVFRAFIPEPGWKPSGFYMKALSPSQEYMSTTYSAGEETPLGGFLSTDKENACCIMELTLEPGVRALWIEPVSMYRHEREILIDKNVAIYNGCTRMKEHSHTPSGKDEPESFNVTVYEYNIKPYETWMSKLGAVLMGACTRRRGANRKKRSRTLRTVSTARTHRLKLGVVHANAPAVS